MNVFTCKDASDKCEDSVVKCKEATSKYEDSVVSSGVKTLLESHGTKTVVLGVKTALLRVEKALPAVGERGTRAQCEESLQAKIAELAEADVQEKLKKVEAESEKIVEGVFYWSLLALSPP